MLVYRVVDLHDSPLCVSHYCDLVTVVGLGGHFLCMAIEDEAVDGRERVQLRLSRRAGALGVDDVRCITHRAACNTSSARFSFRGREPTPMLLSRVTSNGV
jgi:hypothetical protein